MEATSHVDQPPQPESYRPRLSASSPNKPLSPSVAYPRLTCGPAHSTERKASVLVDKSVSCLSPALSAPQCQLRGRCSPQIKRHTYRFVCSVNLRWWPLAATSALSPLNPYPPLRPSCLSFLLLFHFLSFFTFKIYLY